MDPRTESGVEKRKVPTFARNLNPSGISLTQVPLLKSVAHLKVDNEYR
jgi:hypothetical protein